MWADAILLTLHEAKGKSKYEIRISPESSY